MSSRRKPSRTRHGGRVPRLAVAATAAITVAGCAPQTDPGSLPPPPWCGVSVDASGSTAGETLDGYLAAIRPFVRGCAEQGARLHVDLITDNSQANPINPIDLTLEVDQHGSRLMNQARLDNAVDDVMSQITDLRGQAAPGECSDILGGMLEAARVIANTPADDHHLLVATDGLTNCPRDGVDFYAHELISTTDTEHLLATIDDHGLQARFDDAHITLVGIGQTPTAQDLSANQLNLLHDLWIGYCQRGGAITVTDATTKNPPTESAG